MNRKLTLLPGVLMLAFTYACDEGTTAVRTSMPSPSFSWQQALTPPPTLTVTIEGDPNNPQPYEPGDYTFTASVSGGSGNYAYHWFWRGCNVNMEEEWCPSGGYWSSGQSGSSFTTYLGAYDTRLDVVVEVQDISGLDTSSCPSAPGLHACNPPSGKGYLYTPGPLEGYIGVVHGSDWSCEVDGYPFVRFEYNPNTGEYEWVPYRRNTCSGEVEYPN